MSDTYSHPCMELSSRMLRPLINILSVSGIAQPNELFEPPLVRIDVQLPCVKVSSDEQGFGVAECSVA